MGTLFGSRAPTATWPNLDDANSPQADREIFNLQIPRGKQSSPSWRNAATGTAASIQTKHV